jgi:hypothetical protein
MHQLLAFINPVIAVAYAFAFGIFPFLSQRPTVSYETLQISATWLT